MIRQAAFPRCDAILRKMVDHFGDDPGLEPEIEDGKSLTETAA
ncbi:MAG TPA: hypothetical protein VM510_17200 [Caulifigura sp.]|jgi:hypothetical protein|nr:hypothetical protein [Caulifigura sp.]